MDSEVVREIIENELLKSEKRTKELFESELRPIKDTLSKHDTLLYGTGNVVEKVNILTTTSQNIKWVISIFGVFFASGLIYLLTEVVVR